MRLDYKQERACFSCGWYTSKEEQYMSWGCYMQANVGHASQYWPRGLWWVKLYLKVASRMARRTAAMPTAVIMRAKEKLSRIGEVAYWAFFTRV